MAERVSWDETAMAVAHVEFLQYFLQVFLLGQVNDFLCSVTSDLDADEQVNWSRCYLELLIQVSDDAIQLFF